MSKDNGWRTSKSGKKFNIYWNKQKLGKKEYARLASAINTNFGKWNKGLNNQIIDNKVYYFKYKGFDDFEILGKEDYE